MRTALRRAAAVCVAAAVPFVAHGQGVDSLGAAAADTQPHKKPVQALQKKDIGRFGLMLAVTAATMPLDEPIARRFADPDIADNSTYKTLASDLTRIHERSLFFASAITFGVGRLARWKNVADLGYHSMEAIAIGTVIGSILKPTIGRARPYAAGTNNAFIFKPFKGYTDGAYRSFPSLHEIGSFAAASVLTAESGRWAPEWRPYIGAVAYGVAGFVGIGRIYTEQHWASDVVLGSCMGAFIGQRVVHYAHSRKTSRLDHWFLGATPTPDGGGRVAVGYRF